MPRFVFSKCPNCKKENQHNWVDLTAAKPGAKVFRHVTLYADEEQHDYVVTCRHCYTRYKITPPEGGTEDGQA
jgi:hypothetical protein